jgi:pimeloyl-ACP methyl ester carboxylesterase
MTTLSTPVPVGGPGPPPTPQPSHPEVVTRSRSARLGRLALRLLALGAILLVVFVLAFHAYAAWALSHPPIASLTSNPMLAKNLSYSDVTFASADDKTQVDGWWIPADSSRMTIVLSHGYGTNREETWVPMYDLAALLHSLQYNVLMFDYGFASKSHQTAATGGTIESQQLLGAIQFARSQGSDELVVWGFSMGAGTALQAALQSASVDAMILDSTFLPDDDTLYLNIRNEIDIPEYPSVSLIRWFFPLVSGARLSQIPSQQLQNTAFDFPLFLIQGTEDDKAPTYISENIAKAQKNSLSRLWIVPGAIHEMSFRMFPEEYVSRTTEFLGQVHTAALAKAEIGTSRTANDPA